MLSLPAEARASQVTPTPCRTNNTAPASQLSPSPRTVASTPSAGVDSEEELDQETLRGSPTEAVQTRTPDFKDLADHDVRPKLGEVRLSHDAINGRLKRLMTPNLRGNYKISKSIIDMYHSGPKGRKDVQLMFQKVGYDRERVQLCFGGG